MRNQPKKPLTVVSILTVFLSLTLPISTLVLLSSFGTPSSATSSTKISTNLPSYLSLTSTLPSILDNPPKNALVTTSSIATVSTNNEAGYSLILSISPNSGNNTNKLIDPHFYNAEESNTYIASIEEPVVATTSSHSSFPTNTWGYNANTIHEANTYNPLPNPTSEQAEEREHTITTTSSPTSPSSPEANTTLTFATKLNNTLPAGNYTNTLLLTAIANPSTSKKPGLFYNTTYMQDLTSDICNQVETPSPSATTSLSTIYDYQSLEDKTLGVPELHLLDKRDNQEYTIRKLADGNCWMTENLRYGANLDGSVNTDLTDPTKITSNNTDNPATNFQIATIDNSTSDFVTWGNTYTTPRVNIYDANTENTTDTSYNTTKFGALYNYCAATAGNACTTSSTAPTNVDENGNIIGSICPTNWTLPAFIVLNSGTPSDSDFDKSYEKLLNIYGIKDGDGKYSTLAAKPLSFVRAGFVNRESLDGHGTASYYWSSTPRGNVFAYDMFFSGAVMHRNSGGRSDGFAVRCVLK